MNEQTVQSLRGVGSTDISTAKLVRWLHEQA
jgi:hypothetical protein